MKFIKGVHPTYKEQFDKLTRAYIEMKVDPFSCSGCFVGNLLNGNPEWNRAKKQIMIRDLDGHLRHVNDEEISKALEAIDKESKGLYSPKEILIIEKIFMCNLLPSERWMRGNLTEKMEDDLFKNFIKALEALKNLHIAKGEEIEEEFIFKKRELTFS